MSSPFCSTLAQYGPEVKLIGGGTGLQAYFGTDHPLIQHGGAFGVQTPAGQRCVFLEENSWRRDASCSNRVDGMMWGLEAAPNPLPRRVSQNARQVWFAISTEVHNSYWKRPIGDSGVMSLMNYGMHILPNSDFPTVVVKPPQHWGSLAGAFAEEKLWEGKSKGVVYLSSNCRTESERDDFVRRAQHFLDIDSLGECAHNRDWPPRLRTLEYNSDGENLRAIWNNSYQTSSSAIISAYRFRLVLISSICEDYYAEKIEQTLAEGTIPIYLGMPNSHDWDPGIAAGVHPAMIHVQDFDSLAELAAFITSLGADTEEARRRRLRYFEFARNPPTTYPRHAAALMNRTERLDWATWVCRRTHEGDPLRKAEVQHKCRGSWFHYFAELGKDLRKWGCANSSSCAVAGVGGIRNANGDGNAVSTSGWTVGGVSLLVAVPSSLLYAGYLLGRRGRAG